MHQHLKEAMERPSELGLSRQNTSFDVMRLAAMLEPEDRRQMKAGILKIMMNEPAFDKSKKCGYSLLLD